MPVYDLVRFRIGRCYGNQSSHRAIPEAVEIHGHNYIGENLCPRGLGKSFLGSADRTIGFAGSYSRFSRDFENATRLKIPRSSNGSFPSLRVGYDFEQACEQPRKPRCPIDPGGTRRNGRTSSTALATPGAMHSSANGRRSPSYRTRPAGLFRAAAVGRPNPTLRVRVHP